MIQLLFPVVRHTEISSQLAPFVANMAKVFDARIHVLRVEPPTDEYIEMRVKEAAQWLEEFVGRHFDDMTVHQADVVPGEPAEEILRYTECNEIDCIIMGTHGRGNLERALFGSVAAAVVGKSPVPVLTINPNLLTKEFRRRVSRYLGELFDKTR